MATCIPPLSRQILAAASLAVLSLFVAGCVSPGERVADDLLVKTEALAQPIVENGYVIAAQINPKINNAERIDQAVKDSLVVALDQANLFGDNKDQPYKIRANIEIASQAAMSFGNFEGKLQIAYTVLNENNEKLLEKTIYTEAGSDEWNFVGAKRHARARAVNISKNVLEFVDYLKANM